MFENETYENILNRMLARFPTTFDKREGSVLWDLLSPKAIELAQVYEALDNVLKYPFASTTYGEYLDRKVEERGIEPRKSGKASGQITINVPTGTEIVAETRVSTNDQNPIYFLTKETVVSVNNSAQVTVEAEEIGVSGNVLAGTVTVIYGDLANVASITNPENFSGGIDEETDEELLERYLADVRTPSTSGNKYQYEQWAKEVPGIQDARCYPLWNGPGTVKVVVINSEKRSPAQTVIDSVDAYIEDLRPVGANVTVEGVKEIAINVTATLTLREGVNIEDARLSVMDRISEYFKSIAFESDTVRFTSVGNAILDAEGVIDYSDLKINNLTANIILSSEQVPVMGALNVTQI